MKHFEYAVKNIKNQIDINTVEKVKLNYYKLFNIIIKMKINFRGNVFKYNLVE
jgi:hypothetical protein